MIKFYPNTFLKYGKMEVNENKVSELGRKTAYESLPYTIIQTSFLTVAWFFFSVTTYGHIARDIQGNQTDPILEIDANWTDEYTNFRPPHPCIQFLWIVSGNDHHTPGNYHRRKPGW